MRMHVWVQTTLARDGSLSNDVIAHEQTHGTTNRMTGVSASMFEKCSNE
jgi:extracellular elastinolytic metalloproteinase